MTSDNQEEYTKKNPTGADDFQAIHGIGPGIEKRLYQAGIFTYTQLTGFSPEEIVESLGNMIGLTVEKINKQDWLGQAHEMALKKEESYARESNLGERLHYATFTVEVLLNEENAVRRTSVKHVQSLAEKTWAGWDSARLVGFLITNGNIHEILPEAEQFIPQIHKQVLLNEEKVTLSGSMRLHEMTTTPAQEQYPRKTLPAGQPFDIHLTLDASEISAVEDFPLNYRTALFARQLGNRERIPLGQVEGTSIPDEGISVEMESVALSEGTYRLEVKISLSSLDWEHTNRPDMEAFLEGSLLQIY